MEFIKRRTKGIERNHVIYTVEEAEERGLDMAYWRDVQEGQWAVTDDGFVAQCLGRRTYKQERDYIRITCGATWSLGKKPFLFRERQNNKSYYTASTKKWIERQAKTETTRMLAHATAVMWLSGKPIDYDVLADIYSQRNTAPKATRIHYIRKILKSTEVKEMIRQEIQQELLGQGMTITTWMEMGMEIIEKARSSKNLGEMRRMWVEFGDVLQVKEHETQRIPLGEGTKILDAVSEDLKRIPVSQNGK